MEGCNRCRQLLRWDEDAPGEVGDVVLAVMVGVCGVGAGSVCDGFAVSIVMFPVVSIVLRCVCSSLLICPGVPFPSALLSGSSLPRPRSLRSWYINVQGLSPSLSYLVNHTIATLICFVLYCKFASNQMDRQEERN